LILQQNRLQWYGHVLQKEDTDWVKKCMEYELEGSRPRGRAKRTWRGVVQIDCQARNLNREDAMDRVRWKGNWTTRRFANSRTANSQTGHLADCSTSGLDNSRTSQLADWTSHELDNSQSRKWPKKQKLSTQSRRWQQRVVQSASCLVSKLTRPRVVQSASWQSESWRIRELSSNQWKKLIKIG